MSKKILFIRRDNIGDLVCTTPAIHAVRNQYPEAMIGILVNTYNVDAIRNNPDIAKIYTYEKAKHAPDKNKISVWINNLKILREIRKERYDIAIGCGSYSPRLARYTFFTGAKIRIGYFKKGMEKAKFYNSPLYEPEAISHEVEKTFNLLSSLGISGTPPPLRIFPSEDEVKKVQDFLNAAGYGKGKPLIAFHISSRRTENRWPAEKFIELGKLVLNRYNADILLLWSPGSEKNVQHPGDDEKAEFIKNSLKPEPLVFKTAKLGELISALSLSSLVVCCDGGAMHIAAALQKPIVTVWGSTNPKSWAPWGTRHVILTDGKDASNVSVNDVLAAINTMLG